MDLNDPAPWLAVGLLGQVAFASRFLIQWYVSERRQRSVIPMSFWYLSLMGSLLLLVYAIHRSEPVFVLGYLPNSVIYARNIVLRQRQARSESLGPEGGRV